MTSLPPISAPAVLQRTDGWSGYPGGGQVTHEPHVVGNMARTHRPAMDPPGVFKSQDMGPWRLSWPARQTPAVLS